MTEFFNKIPRKGYIIAISAMGMVLTVLLAAVLIMNISASAPEAVSAPPTYATYPPEETLPEPEGNPYGPEDFSYEGDYLTCISGESVLGIDISAWQTVEDWQEVKDAGIEFVIIRVGYRGYGEGDVLPDEKAQEHYEGAKSVGLKVGVYFFSQAVNTKEAVEEAKFTLDFIKDWQIDLPVVYDWEYVSGDARTWWLEALDLTHVTMAFCNTVEDAGYRPMVYFNQNQGKYLLQLERLTGYDFWLAMYDDYMDYPYKLDMWQYSCEGEVPGIEGPVDMNLWFPEV